MKFKNCDINVSEDFSKETLNVHKQLLSYGKQAKESLFTDDKKGIKYYKIAYRRLILTYTTDKKKTDALTFTRSFSLDFIKKNQKWYVPPVRQNS